MKITEPGIYTMTAEEYHADPCPMPSLSSSIAKELLQCSAWHAWHAHPKLNRAFVREEQDKFNLGTAVHAYILEGETNFVIVNERTWQTNAAKAAKADARLHKKTPLLAEQWQRVQEMAAALEPQLDRFEDRPRPFLRGAGKPEQTVIWREGELWFRARFDWLHDTRRNIDDLKSTDASANPEAWSRTLFNMGFDIQAAFYVRGLRAVAQVDPVFRFVVQETYPPYAACVIGLHPLALEVGTRKVEYVINLWRECLATKRWPGYPSVTCWAEPPAWELAKWPELGAPRPAVPQDDGSRSLEELMGLEKIETEDA